MNRLDALTRYYIRRAALDVMTYNPAANIYVPEEPDHKEVVDQLTTQMLKRCANKHVAEQYNELLIEDLTDIIHRVGQAFASLSQNELQALGADILFLVSKRMKEQAEKELLNE